MYDIRSRGKVMWTVRAMYILGSTFKQVHLLIIYTVSGPPTVHVTWESYLLQGNFVKWCNAISIDSVNDYPLKYLIIYNYTKYE